MQRAPGTARIAAQQERVDRGGERRALERRAIEGRVLARRLDFVDEGEQARRRQRPAFGRLGQTRRERGRVGQGGEAGALRRRARQEARRRGVALQHAVLRPGRRAGCRRPRPRRARRPRRRPTPPPACRRRRRRHRRAGRRRAPGRRQRSGSGPRAGRARARAARRARPSPSPPAAATPQRQRGSAAAAPRISWPSWRRRPAPGAPSGAITGKTKRVVAAAASRPAIENTPSWARPGKPAKTSAAKPISEVTRPSRTVGQLSRSQRRACDASPFTAAAPAGARAWIR